MPSGCVIYELCPRVDAFIFNGPSALGGVEGRTLWDEGKEESQFLTLEYIKPVRMSSFFSPWWYKFDDGTSAHWRLLL